MHNWHVLVYLCVLHSHVCFICSYQMATSHVSYIRGPVAGSYFGYAVVPHKSADKLTLYVGTPRFAEVDSFKVKSPARQGAIYKCDFANSNFDLRNTDLANCSKLNLEEKGQLGNAEVSAMALDSCDMSLFGFCGFTNHHTSDFNWTLTNRSGMFKKVRGNKFQIRNQSCSGCKRISGPPSYTVNDKYLNADSNVFNGKDFNHLGASKKYILVSPKIRKWKSLTQCLRFCYYAFSACHNCKRKLKVLLMDESRPLNGSQTQLFLFDGTKRNASRYWDHVEINITSPVEGNYHLIFEATVYNNKRRKFRIPGTSDIVLADISVSNLPCSEEITNLNEIESEQSIGLHLETKSGKQNDSIFLATCGPLWQQNCGHAKEVSGVCYEVYANATRVLDVNKYAPIPQECIRGKIDIVFLVDQSGSVNQCNFQKVKRWLRNIVRGFTLGVSQQDVGVVVYSNPGNTRVVIDFGFKKFGNDGENKMKYMVNILKELPYEAGQTYTGTAFKTANQMLFGKNARVDAKKIIILLTDGATTKKDRKLLKAQTSLLRKRNVTILAVGVARYLESELVQITGNKKNFFAVKKFSELEKIRDKLRSSVSIGKLETGFTLSANNTSDQLQQCQTGFSAGYFGESLLMGSPGCYDSFGNVIRHDSTNVLNMEIVGSGAESVLQQKNESSKMDQYVIPTLRQLKQAFVEKVSLGNSYFGYAMTVGRYFGKDRDEHIASSAPRFNGTGGVLMFSYGHQVSIIRNELFRGRQLGEYYGAILTSEDVNSDGFDDLFVGSPLHTANNPDEGRVYVYMGGRTMSRFPDVILDGSRRAFSRFGSQIASVGDMDLDGFPEIAISATLEDETGVVYLYHGYINGLDTKTSQKIVAKKLSPLPDFFLDGFGVSLSGHIDIDSNGFPDLIIGAPKSDAIVVVLSRPVVYSNISLNCDSMNKHQVFFCYVCFSQNGVIMINNSVIQYTIKVDQQYKRATFLQTQTRTLTDYVTLLRKQSCRKYGISLKTGIRDMMHPIHVTLWFKLSNVHQNDFGNRQQQRTRMERSTNGNNTERVTYVKDPILPILYINDPTTHNAIVPFRTNCQSVTVCKSDLSVEIFLIDQHGNKVHDMLVERNKNVRLKVKIKNEGPDDAHDVSINLLYPKLISFASTGVIKGRKTQLIEDLDSEPKVLSTGILRKFDLFPPNLSHKETSFEQVVLFDISSTSYDLRRATFVVNVTSISIDSKPINNWKQLEVNVTYIAKLLLKGRSIPNTCTLPINASTDFSNIESIVNVGVNIIHRYDLTNIGSIDLNQLTVNISWPAYLKFKTNLYNLLYVKSISCNAPKIYCWCEYKKLDSYGFSSKNNTKLYNDSFFKKPPSEIFDASKKFQFLNLVQYVQLLCHVHNLTLGNSVRIEVTAIPYPPTLINSVIPIKVQSKGTIELISPGSIQIQQYGNNQAETEIFGNLNILQTIINNQKTSTIFELPFWVYIISIGGGVLLLLIILLLLRHIGFFKSRYADKKRAAQEESEWGEAAMPLKT